MSNFVERLGNMAAALRRRREHDARMRWSRDALADYQRRRLGELVRHATAHSPFYRARFGGVIDRDVELAELPILTKAQMMASYDQLTTDPRLRRDALLAHVATIRGDDRFAGEFRAMTSSGSSGQKALYVYDRAAWQEGFLPGSLRMSRIAGLAPRLPRPRIATIAAGDGKHMTFRGGASMDVGLFRSRRFLANAPIDVLVRDLARYQPDFVLGYPSVLALLADEQRGGKLAIAPRVVVTSSEVRTDSMTAAIRAAWGVEPFNCLGMTETGIAAVDCHVHCGLHVFEDLCILEAVDDANRPVPPRTPGAKLLVTNLYNHAQPIIRFEVSDLVTFDDAPCACGITFQRIIALDGRSDDLLVLPASQNSVTVHPIHLRSVLGAHPDVLQYQVVHDRDQIVVDAVLAAGAAADTTLALQRALDAALRERGACVMVNVRAVPAIPREGGAGKLKLVRSIAPT